MNCLSKFLEDVNNKFFLQKKLEKHTIFSSIKYKQNLAGVSAMRMWGIDPKFLCNQHLLGEHFEIHKHRHNFEKKHKINKRVDPIVQIEPENMEKRHNELVEEMRKRDMKHNSPYTQPDISYLPPWQQRVKIDKDLSISDLINRCKNCKINLVI